MSLEFLEENSPFLKIILFNSVSHLFLEALVMQQSGAEWRGTLLPSAQTNPSAELFLFPETLEEFLFSFVQSVNSPWGSPSIWQVTLQLCSVTDLPIGFHRRSVVDE